MLNNLISNAIKYAPSGSSVDFNLTLNGNNLSLSVKDQGPGISPSEQQKIFQRFYQSEETPSVGGVGVGLALVKDFANSLNGDVSVVSDLGKGATFIITIPVQFANNPKVEEESIAEGDLKEGFQFDGDKSLHVLIVEDNLEMSRFLEKILSKSFQCDRAFDGEEAFQMIHSRKYDFIISDVMMPKMDGFQFRKKMNELSYYRNVPFIFLTAKYELKDRIEGYTLGIDDYLVKPFHQDELLARMRNALKNKNERENWIKDNLDFVGDKTGTSEEQMLDKIKQVIRENISNEEFKVNELAEQVGYSSRQLSRITHKLTGMSTVQFVLELRLQKAFLLLTEKKLSTLAEVRHQVGIPTASHFNKKFFERFGRKPSDMK